MGWALQPLCLQGLQRSDVVTLYGQVPDFFQGAFLIFFSNFCCEIAKETSEAVFFIFFLFLTCGMEVPSFHEGWSHAFESKTYLPSLLGNCRTLWIVPFFKL